MTNLPKLLTPWTIPPFPPRPPISAAMFIKLPIFRLMFPPSTSRLSLPHSQLKIQPLGAFAYGYQLSIPQPLLSIFRVVETYRQYCLGVLYIWQTLSCLFGVSIILPRPVPYKCTVCRVEHWLVDDANDWYTVEAKSYRYTEHREKMCVIYCSVKRVYDPCWSIRYKVVS